MHLPRNVAVPLICLVLTVVVCVYGQDTNSGTTAAQKSACESKKTCDKCISTAYCKWCSATNDKRPVTQPAKSTTKGDPLPRCVHDSTPNESWCVDNIINPRADHDVMANEPFSNISTNEVQLRPQSLNVKLRAGQEYKVKIDYKQAQGYPVDLYFLMDLSYSMETHRDKLSGLGEDLAKAMMDITSNFRLGFGSFVDKYILPMTSTQPEWLNNYCKLKDQSRCATPYDFKHQMNLTSNHTEFKARVTAAPISGNIDTPEGGLDALMQAMVCDDAIGWRKKARHIIVYSSDATYHIAGDGRLAGLIEPNDEQCHLDKDGYYDQAEILDYPSISQIKKIAHDKSKNIIFAVTRSVSKEYEELSKVLKPGLDATGILQEGNSSNVVALVKKFTEELTSNIRMTARVPDKFADMFKIEYTSRPTGNSEGVKCKKNSCSGISEKTPIEFEVSITALRCPEQEADRRQKIELELDGIPEKVVIDVDIICSCGCSREGNSAKCGGHGDFACGVCECHPGFEKDDCSCKVQDSEQGDPTGCVGPNSTLTCSGHGVCNSCGVCSKCDDGPNKEAGDKYYGEFCQCDNFLCPRTNYMPCGGPERGECLCGGKCQCKSGYEGESCQCETEESCIQPGGNGEPCNGFGECKCGKCQCTKDNKRSGKYCEQCTICVNEFCDKHKDCVECLAYQTGPRYTEDGKCANCTDVQLEGKVDNLNETAPGTDYCMVLDSTSCTFAFAYVNENKEGDLEKKLMVTAEKEKKCPPPAASPWTVAISAIALTLFLGLLGLIIWKILTMYHDHREWVKFEKERASAKWERGDNPLFKGATTDFQNPTFGQESK